MNDGLYLQSRGGLGVLELGKTVVEGKELTVPARLLCTRHCARLLTHLDFIWLFFWLLCKFGGVIHILQMRKQIK